MIANPSIILAAVCCEFEITPEKVLREYTKVRAHPEVRIRRIYWYLCRLHLRAFNKKTRTTQTGGLKPVARILGVTQFSLQRACIEVEDLRDDPEFDARLEKLEKSLYDQIGVAFSSAG